MSNNNIITGALADIATYSNGRVTDISLSGNVTGQNSVFANSVTANLFIGTFQGNIAGNLVVPGANTQVLYNNNGNAGADIGFTYDAGTQTANIGNTLNVTNNINVGNILGNGNIVTNGRLSGANVTGNIAQFNWANVVNDFSVGGNVTANGNVSGTYVLGNGAFLTGIVASGYGDANVEALLASGNVSTNIITTGNVTGAYILSLIHI